VTSRDNRNPLSAERVLAQTHPEARELLVFNQFGDVERCALRPGNDAKRRRLARGAGAGDCSLPGGAVQRLYFLGDAAFANPEMYQFLEADNLGYTIGQPRSMVEPGPRLGCCWSARGPVGHRIEGHRISNDARGA
jgi:hypothetical protein